MNITRNSKGVCRVNGKKVAKIPRDQSVFSFLGNPANFVPNGDYTIDKDWIYVSGKPVRKQLHKVFGESSENVGIMIWLPNISDVSLLERRYWRTEEAKERWHKTKFMPVFNALSRSKTAHAKPSHRHNGDQDDWWLLHSDGESWGFDWVRKPSTPKNMKVGQKFYDIEKFGDTVYRRVASFRIALEARLREELDRRTGSRSGYLRQEDAVKMHGRQVTFRINGRNYWYHCTFNKHGVPCWRILSWPTNKAETYVIENCSGQEGLE